MKDADPGTKGLVVQPFGLLQAVKEIAQGPGRLAQRFGLLFDARADETMQVVRSHRGKLLHDRIEFGVADGRVPDVIVGARLRMLPRLRILRRIGGGHLRHRGTL